MPPTIPTLVLNKTYADLDRLDEIDLDNGYNSIITWDNTYIQTNLPQLALDAYGSSYVFNQNGLQTVTNTLFDKQTQTKLYSGGDIAIGLLVDGAFGAVDAVNAAITITPEKAGKYAAYFQFTHTFELNATSEGVCETLFRITDGISVSRVARSGGYFPAPAANGIRFVENITLAAEFSLLAAATTITLQKRVVVATNIATHVVNATATTGEIGMRVEKI